MNIHIFLLTANMWKNISCSKERTHVYSSNKPKDHFLSCFVNAKLPTTKMRDVHSNNELKEHFHSYFVDAKLPTAKMKVDFTVMEAKVNGIFQDDWSGNCCVNEF